MDRRYFLSLWEGLDCPPIYGKKDNYPFQTKNRQKISDEKRERRTILNGAFFHSDENPHGNTPGKASQGDTWKAVLLRADERQGCSAEISCLPRQVCSGFQAGRADFAHGEIRILR